MDDLIERERALVVSFATDTCVEQPKRQKGRWDKRPSGEAAESEKMVRATSNVPPWPAKSDTPADLQSRLLEAHRSVIHTNKPCSDESVDGNIQSIINETASLHSHQGFFDPSTRSYGQAMFGNATLEKKRRWDVAGSDTNILKVEARAIPSIEMLSRLDPDLPAMRPEDYSYFSCLFQNGAADVNNSKAIVARLLLKIKNGSLTVRRQAIRELYDQAPSIGAGPIFDFVLPLLTGAPLDAIERHSVSNALCQVVSRLGWKCIDEHIHRILVAIEPMLMDEDPLCRTEGRTIVSSLANMAGVANVLPALQYDSISSDDYVRGATARILAILASIDDTRQALEYIKSLCLQTGDTHTLSRLTGLRAISYLAQYIGMSILPNLSFLVKECIAPVASNKLIHSTQSHRPSMFHVMDTPGSFGDTRISVAALSAISSLAEAVFPHGIETFEFLLPETFSSGRFYRGKARATWLRSTAALMPLMTSEQADYFARVLIKDYVYEDVASSDIDCRRFALRLCNLCTSMLMGSDAKGIVESKVMFSLLSDGWSRRTVLDRRATRELIDTTLAVAQVVGPSIVLQLLSIGGDNIHFQTKFPDIKPALKDSNDALRSAAVDATSRIISIVGVSDLDERIFAMIVDAFLEFPNIEDTGAAKLIYKAWEVLFRAGGVRLRPVVVPVASAILWRLANKSPYIRRSAACLAGLLPIAVVSCRWDAASSSALTKVSNLLVENLGEQSPDVLASLILALCSIADAICTSESVIASKQESVPLDISDLLPRISPILRSKHENIQEACLSFISKIAEKMPEAAGPREWMRICFELIDMLRAQRRSIRRLAISAFGSIARAIGPYDVLSALMSNLRVQERQNRVCTTLAIAIIAEKCGPFAVLPMLLCEYRVPELNVQNGVLKSIAYMLEHVSAAGRPYVYTLAPVLEDALTDRDQVHRQTATTALRFLSLCMAHHGGDDVVGHLLNAALPSVLDPDPHLAIAIHDALDAARLTMGPGAAALYLLQGLFHAARRVRIAYWRLWNALYLSSSPSLALVYPSLEGVQLQIDDGMKQTQCYTHHLLDVIL